MYFTPTEEATRIEVHSIPGNNEVAEEKMPELKSVTDHLKVWKDAGFIYYYNSKQFKTLLIKRQDVSKLAYFLMQKLEKVQKVWSESAVSFEFPYRNPQNLTIPALTRMLNFFWNSKFCIMDKKNIPKHKFWRQNETGVGNRVSFAVYSIQMSYENPMKSSERAHSLWFPLLKANRQTRIMFKNKN